MDETGKVGQDSPLVEGQASPEKDRITPPEPETYTKAQVEKMLSDGKSAMGRRAKELESQAKRAEAEVALLRTRAEASEATLSKLQRERDDIELQTARDNPDLLSVYQQKQELRRQELEIARGKQEILDRQAQMAHDLAEVSQFRIEQAAERIAKEYGGDPSILISLTDGTTEKMEALAKLLSQSTKGKSTAPATPVITPDSGLGSGSLGELDTEQLDKLSPEEYSKYRQKYYDRR